MAIQVYWDNVEQTIIVWDFDPHWTFDDAWQTKQVGDKMIDDLPHDKPVVFLAHFADNGHLPPLSLSAAKSILQQAHPRIILTVFVSRSSFIKAMANIFIRVSSPFIKAHLMWAATLDEARAIAQEHLANP